jgi:hypothetical protein
MKENQDQNNQTDRNLDIPSEANRGKHANFLDDEGTGGTKDASNDERKEEWQTGVSEGRHEANKTPLSGNTGNTERKGEQDDTAGIP